MPDNKPFKCHQPGSVNADSPKISSAHQLRVKERFHVAKNQKYTVGILTSILAAFVYNLYISPIGMGVLLLLVLLVLGVACTGFIYGILWIVGQFDSYRQAVPKPVTNSKRIKGRFALLAVMWVGVAVGLCWLNVPRKAAVLVFRPQFTSLQTLPLTPPATGSWIGPWKVKNAKVDERGGLYLVAGEAMDGIDTIFAGPAYRPNRTGSPFGRAGYTLHHLHGDWYWFHTSNDW